MTGAHGILDWAVAVAFALMLTGLVLTFTRLVRGPSLIDRVIALDLLTLLVVGFIGVFAIASGESILLDIAVALALVAFLATVAFARYVERRSDDHEAERTQSVETCRNIRSRR